jgi:hypothetical protein
MSVIHTLKESKRSEEKRDGIMIAKRKRDMKIEQISQKSIFRYRLYDIAGRDDTVVEEDSFRHSREQIRQRTLAAHCYSIDGFSTRDYRDNCRRRGFSLTSLGGI